MAMLNQYGNTSGNPPTIDKVGFVTMLDAIESNISDESINGMFAMLKRSPNDEITFTEAVDILELKVKRSLSPPEPISEKRNERLMEIRICPICEKRLKRGDFDNVTHIALCSHANFEKLDRIAMGGFMTRESASSKWLTKIFSYVTFGGMGIGKNSGHILYQDRQVIFSNLVWTTFERKNTDIYSTGNPPFISSRRIKISSGVKSNQTVSEKPK
jgi:hypothetical protein